MSGERRCTCGGSDDWTNLLQHHVNCALRAPAEDDGPPGVHDLIDRADAQMRASSGKGLTALLLDPVLYSQLKVDMALFMEHGQEAEEAWAHYEPTFSPPVPAEFRGLVRGVEIWVGEQRHPAAAARDQQLLRRMGSDDVSIERAIDTLVCENEQFRQVAGTNALEPPRRLPDPNLMQDPAFLAFRLGYLEEALALVQAADGPNEAFVLLMHKALDAAGAPGVCGEVTAEERIERLGRMARVGRCAVRMHEAMAELPFEDYGLPAEDEDEED